MADQLQLRRGTTAQIATFTGAQGEIVVDTDKDTIVVQDGATPGGFPLASEAAVVDGTFYFNDDVSGGSIANSYVLSPKANTNIPTSYMDGQQYGFVTANANTGPSTATFSGLGVRSLKWPGGVDPSASEVSGRTYLIYDQTNDWFEIQDITRSLLDTVRINVTSTASVSLVASAPNTRHVNITGTTTITGFVVNPGDCYFVRFAASLTLTNNAAIVTQSGINIVTQAGDTCIIRATAANVVEVLAYTPGINQALGYGQTWQNVTGSRFSGTTYTNTTGRSIVIQLWMAPTSSGDAAITVAGELVAKYVTNNTTAGATGTISAIIPAGATYSYTVSGAAVQKVVELR